MEWAPGAKTALWVAVPAAVSEALPRPTVVPLKMSVKTIFPVSEAPERVASTAAVRATGPPATPGLGNALRVVEVAAGLSDLLTTWTMAAEVDDALFRSPE